MKRLYLTMSLVFTGIIFSYSQTIETVIGFSQDMISAETAQISPRAIDFDEEGNLIFSDSPGIIWKLNPATNSLNRIAGSRTNTAFSGDGGNALESKSAAANDLAVDADGNIYLATNKIVRVIDSRTGLIYPVAGSESGGYSEDGVRATFASLEINGIAVDDNHNLYIAEDSRLRKVDLETGVITTVAGTGEKGFGGKGDGGLAAAAKFRNIMDVAVDGYGNLYLADGSDNRIRKIDAETGIINTIVGGTGFGFSGDGGPANEAQVSFQLVGSNLKMFIQGDDLYFRDQGVINGIRKIDLGTNIIETIVGGPENVSEGIQIPPFKRIYGITVSNEGELIFTLPNSIQKVERNSSVLTAIAGVEEEEWGEVAVENAVINIPTSLAFDSRENLYFISQHNLLLRKDAISNIISSKGRISGIGGLVLSGDSVIYYCSRYSGEVYAFNLKSGKISEVAGSQYLGRSLMGIDLDADGNIYVADERDRRIRKIDIQSGYVTTLNIDRSTGRFLAIGDDGNIYFDAYGYLTYKADLVTGRTTLLPGRYTDGIQGLTFDNDNSTLYITSGNKVYQIDPEKNVSSVLAGMDEAGFAGDGGPSVDAYLSSPRGLVLDSKGNVYVTDYNNNRIRRINMPGGDKPLALNLSGSFWSERGSYRPVQWKRGRVQFEIEINEEGRGNVNVNFDKVPMYFRKSKITTYQQFGELFVIEGEGTINNEGSYTFMIRYARDTDKIRIVISDAVSEEIVYDNELGEDLLAEPDIPVSDFDAFPQPTDIVSSTSVDDIESADEISDAVVIYPNPTKDVLSVYIPIYEGLSEVRMEITDLNGKVLLTKAVRAGSNADVSVELLDAGVYLVKLDMPGGSESYRIVKE